jgi:hypothetical protein
MNFFENEVLVPKKVEMLGGSFKKGSYAAKTNIKEKNYSYLLSLCGVSSVEVVEGGKTPNITIGEVCSCGCDLEGYSYHVRISENGICICGENAEAVSNGVKMVIQIMAKGEIPCMDIYDTPTIRFRGTHFCIFRPDDGTEKEDTCFEKVKERLEKVALWGYNYVSFEFWGMFPYEKHPYACWPNGYTRAEVRELIDFAIDDLHVTPFPTQNLTSHAGWSRIVSRKHVVLDQRPDLAEMYIPGGWCFATRNEKTKTFLRDVIEDLVKTFRNPPMLHCSCDKCFGFGSTEEDRVVEADELFVEHLNFLHDELTKHGVRMVMWADMLYSSMDVKYWKCAPGVAEKLPKDILMNIWTHNDIGNGEWGDVDFFEGLGFETVYSPFLDKAGAANMINLCGKKGSLGILQTTWYCPETALSTVKFSAKKLWNNN